MRPFLTSDDVMAITGYSRSQAYLIISELNRELEKQACLRHMRHCAEVRRNCGRSFALKKAAVRSAAIQSASRARASATSAARSCQKRLYPSP